MSSKIVEVKRSSLAPFDDVKALAVRMENEILKIKEVQDAMGTLRIEYDKAVSLNVTTEAGYAAAGESLKVIADNVKRLKDGIQVTPSGGRMKELKAALHALHKLAKAIEDTLVADGTNAEYVLKDKSRAYVNEQQRLQDILTLKANAEKEKEKEALRKRLEAAKRESTKETIQAQIEQVVAAAPVILPGAAPGVKRVKVWNAEITDKRSLILWLLDNHLTGFIGIKESEIARHAKDMGIGKIPGVKITTSWDVHRR